MTAPSDNPRLTPMLKQYFGVKRQYPEALLFFRMGDFFELFYEDARIAAEVLGIALTSRSKEQDMPMAGVPVRAVDTYLRKLIQAGKTVVICDQIQDPREAKGIVERAVTRIVTAGTVLEDELLDGTRHNYLAAIAPPASGEADAPAGLAWIDVSTGRFEGVSVPRARLTEELLRLAPAELLLPESLREKVPAEVAILGRPGEDGPALSFRPDHEFEPDLAHAALCRQFEVGDLAGFGIERDEPLVGPAGAVLSYVAETQRGMLGHVRRIGRRRESGRMLIDRAARHALELLETSRERRREGSLLWCLDRTQTAAGARLLRDWVLSPLTDLDETLERQAAVAVLFDQDRARELLRVELKGVFDIERITARLALNRSSPRDLAQLRDSLERLPVLAEIARGLPGRVLTALAAGLTAPPDLLELLSRALVEAPPLGMKDGGVIRRGFSAELDELRDLKDNSKSTIAALQEREIQRTGIPSLKVGFNSVFGYYLEVTHAHRQRVPDDYVRKQTLKNAERYITPELKEYETRVLRAQEQALDLELRLFEEVRTAAAARVPELQSLATVLATLDALQSLAEASREHGYHAPTLDDSCDLVIEEGFHPVLARTLGRDSFVPNDTRLGAEHARLGLITGPNMAGKSTYLRQTALIALMAQIGCFVPARQARIGLVDRIFTRVGASDDLVRGASTFMVEMTETASILHHASERSLVILDEIGRGTGTFDGLSLARALAEHLASVTRCRTLFATHYHQLTQLADELPGVQNLSVLVREWGEEIIFLHRIVSGGTDRSYGIHVARLAGIPPTVLERAREVLGQLESRTPELRVSPPGDRAGPVQEPLFSPPVEQVLKALRRLSVESLTPLEALNELSRLQELALRDRAPRSRRRPPPTGPSLFERAAGGD